MRLIGKQINDSIAFLICIALLGIVVWVAPILRETLKKPKMAHTTNSSDIDRLAREAWERAKKANPRKLFF